MAKKRLAIFDIDGTVFRSSLVIELFNELVRRGVFPKRANLAVQRNYELWRDRKGHYNDYLMLLVSTFYRNLGGCATRSVDPVVRTVIKRQRDRVHRFPRELMADLRKRGYFILALSNSPEPMVRAFASAMKFDAAIGHVLEIKNGVYTGQSIVQGRLMPGRAFIDKVEALNRFLHERKIRADIRNSVMIGDSEGDIPLLSHVGKPIAFNPSLTLARVARQRGWRMVVERKDAVFDIRDARFIPVRGQSPRIPYGNDTR